MGLYKEINFCGIFLAPFFLCLLIAGVLYLPLHWCCDRFEIERWFWNRPVLEAALFIILLRLVAVIL